MQITAEYLTELKERAEHEQRRLLDQAQQATGAIAMIDAMIARLSEEEPKQPNYEPQPPKEGTANE